MTTKRRSEEVTWWLVGVLVLAVLVSGVGLLIRQILVVPDRSAPTPPQPSAASPTVTPTASGQPLINPADPRVVRPGGRPLLPGSGPDQVFVQSSTAIYRIELATGQIIRTPTPLLDQHSSFVAGPGWVVFKTIDNDPGVVVRNGHRAAPLPPALRPNGRLYPAQSGGMWLVPENPTRGARVVTRVNVNNGPDRNETIRLSGEIGLPSADAAHYLFATNSGGTYQFRPSGVRKLTTGDLLAVGRHHLLVWDCDKKARCNPYRLDRTHGRRTTIPAARKAILKLYQGNVAQAEGSGGGDLSPDGTHTALRYPGNRLSSWPIAVVDLSTGQTRTLPGNLTDTNPNSQFAWTANGRYFLAITDHQMRAYDTTTGTTRTIPVGTDPLLHLTSTQASGN
ncbi:MAG TPA: hypothetical protein VF635_07210 [Propionibacteriaceae bacterium]